MDPDDVDPVSGRPLTDAQRREKIVNMDDGGGVMVLKYPKKKVSVSERMEKLKYQIIDEAKKDRKPDNTLRDVANDFLTEAL